LRRQDIYNTVGLQCRVHSITAQGEARVSDLVIRLTADSGKWWRILENERWNTRSTSAEMNVLARDFGEFSHFLVRFMQISRMRSAHH